MKLFNAVILILMTSVAFAGRPCTDEEFSKTLAKELPNGAEAIIRRIIECNHWGEEAGDTSPERTKQIEAGVKKSKCETIEKDRSTFINLHPKDKKIPEAFSKAESWSGSCE
jgi:hypothetical protein